MMVTSVPPLHFRKPPSIYKYTYTNWCVNTAHSKTYKKSVVKKEWSTASSGMDVMSPTQSLFVVWPFGVEIDDTSPEDAKSSISGNMSMSKSNSDQSTISADSPVSPVSFFSMGLDTGKVVSTVCQANRCSPRGRSPR